MILSLPPRSITTTESSEDLAPHKGLSHPYRMFHHGSRALWDPNPEEGPFECHSMTDIWHNRGILFNIGYMLWRAGEKRRAIIRKCRDAVESTVRITRKRNQDLELELQNFDLWPFVLWAHLNIITSISL